MSQDERNLIKTRSLTKKFGDVVSLDDLSIMVPKGATGLLGPNGAGKSTLLRCLLGLLRPTGGSGEVLGHSITTDSISIRSQIGYMPEHDCLIPEMDAVNFLSKMGQISGMVPEDALQRAHECLYYVEIGDERYRLIRTYSSGMVQRVKLAQALVHDPQLIFLDEPTSGMDPKGRTEMLELIRDIATSVKKDIILSTHLLPDVEYCCEHVIIIDQGHLVFQGGIKEALSNPSILEIKVKGDNTGFASSLRDLGLNIDIEKRFIRVLDVKENTLDDIMKVAAREGVQIRSATSARRSLEDLFMEQVGQGRKKKKVAPKGGNKK